MCIRGGGNLSRVLAGVNWVKSEVGGDLTTSLVVSLAT